MDDSQQTTATRIELQALFIWLLETKQKTEEINIGIPQPFFKEE